MSTREQDVHSKDQKIQALEDSTPPARHTVLPRRQSTPNIKYESTTRTLQRSNMPTLGFPSPLGHPPTHQSPAFDNDDPRYNPSSNHSHDSSNSENHTPLIFMAPFEPKAKGSKSHHLTPLQISTMPVHTRENASQQGVDTNISNEIQTLTGNETPLDEPVSSNSSRAFDTNYPDSNRPSQAASSHHRQPHNPQSQSFDNDQNCNTPSNHSQSSSNSESRAPLNTMTPHQMSALPAFTRENASLGILSQAWHNIYQATLRDAKQAHAAETEKLRAENEALSQKLNALEKEFAQMKIEKLAIENQLASAQQKDYFNSQDSLNMRAPHINLASLPSTQSNSATGTPSSTSTTVEPGSISSSTKTTPLRVASRPTLRDIWCGCFKP